MASSRAFSALGIALLSASLLAGCSSSESSDDNAPAVQQSRSANKTDQITSDPSAFFITLPNGAKVLCAGVNDQNVGYGGGTNFDCDWTNAQHLNVPAPAR
jgi:hypothetical protein